MTNLTKQLQDLLYPYAPNKQAKIEMDTKIIPAIQDLLAEELEAFYQKGLRDSVTDTCSITGCTEKATTGINNQDYCDKHFEEQRKAVELKLKELTDNDDMTDKPIDLDSILVEFGQILQRTSPEATDKISRAYRQAKSDLTNWADQRAIQIIGEDEKGEIVQVGCPDLNPGCLVLHSEFKMTHEVKARNQLRAELRKAFKRGEK